MLELLQKEHRLYVSEYMANEFSEKIQIKWSQKADKVLRVFRDLTVCFCNSSDKMQGIYLMRNVEDWRQFG